ncbi:hypothetical protein DQ04_15701010 [Trypanosoma grayi]|uniref:hypothetical protein n=1 Tax=Trypanosoma grayi TaxID=71804 RepID=UPI0004F41CC8|nr:hypothetical protein DQ04_15701010 [Trypanosoma grayi]KEG06141.1 hypothetical protein DQ04_15701010 [Trypanosoma grayi]
MLDEQQEEAGRLLALSSSLRGENEELLQRSNELTAECDRQRTQLRMLERAPEASCVSLLSSTPADAASSGDEKGVGGRDDAAEMTTAAKVKKALDEQLQKQKVLDMREATLQEAQKKVANDAARVAARRMQLQKDERTLRTRLAQELHGAIEDESRRLQDVHLEELAGLGKQFAAWLSSATAAVEQMRVAHNNNIDSNVGRSANDEVTALKHEHAAEMVRRQEAHQTQIAQLERAMAQARDAYEDAAAKKQKRFHDDLLVLQSTTSAAQRQLEDERQQCLEARRAVDELASTLEEERRQHEAVCTELRERLEALQSMYAAAANSNDGRGSCNNSGRDVEVGVPQRPNTDPIAPALCTVLSGWRCVVESLLQEHSAVLDAVALAARALCSNVNAPRREPAAVVLSRSENAEETNVLRRELSEARRLAKDIEERASEHALQVVALKREAAATTEELQQLREKLSRTEKALLRASTIEKRLSQQLFQQQQQQQQCREESCASGGGGGGDANSSSNSSHDAVALATLVVAHSHAYADACTRLVGDACLHHYKAGTQVLQGEWEKRRELTRRNAIALEETTASIKAFQDRLKQREVLVATAEESLRGREREVRVCRGRLMKVSAALQTVAGRLRAAAMGEQITLACSIDAG